MKLLPLPKHWLERIAEDPNGEFAKKALKIQAKIDTVNAHQTVLEKIENKSSVGTRLKEIFRARVGAVPCGRCKATIESLNKMTVEYILSHKEDIVKQIKKNSEEASMSWWAKVVAHCDEKWNKGKLTTHMLIEWLEDACDLSNQQFVPEE